MKKKIFYWSPFLSPIATSRALINSASSLIKFSQNYEIRNGPSHFAHSIEQTNPARCRDDRGAIRGAAHEIRGATRETPVAAHEMRKTMLENQFRKISRSLRIALRKISTHRESKRRGKFANKANHSITMKD